MSYLMIRNPGVADYRGFTLLGVSTTRNSGMTGTIGQFGSGSKHSIALLLRFGIEPVIVCGNLKMTFFVKREEVKGQVFRRVCVKFSGKDVDGSTNNRTEDLGFTLEWGVQDWKKLNMALREFVSNGIDGAICAGQGYKNVQIEVVSEPRAKADHTSVFIPYTPEIEACHAGLDKTFLHLGKPEFLSQKCLPKRFPEDNKVYIYKKGVLVCFIAGKSVNDYNLGDELTLDESRNASEWDVKYAIACAMRNESADSLVKILKGVISDPTCFEGKLETAYLQNNKYENEEVQLKRKTAFKEAWKQVAGEKGVVSSDNVAIQSFITQKGYNPIPMPTGWKETLESYGIVSEMAVLTPSEMDGNQVSEPTQEMLDCTNHVWGLFETYKLTNGKSKPEVKQFTSIMGGGSQCYGYYKTGGNTIFLHGSLGKGKMMFKVALEEIVHYTTGSDDMSRDIQDFLFNLITEIAF